MSGLKIDANDLAKTVDGLLQKFGETAEVCLSQAVWDTAKDVVKELKKGGGYSGGEDYNKGWSRTMTRKRLYSQATIYNKTRPELTSWLEKGHAKRNGGRTRSFPHIAPVNDRVPDLFTDNFTDLLAEELINNL